jgi:hypothetical protein
MFELGLEVGECVLIGFGILGILLLGFGLLSFLLKNAIQIFGE